VAWTRRRAGQERATAQGLPARCRNDGAANEVGTDQPQALDALGVGEADVLVDVVHAGSSGRGEWINLSAWGRGNWGRLKHEIATKLKRGTTTAIFATGGVGGDLV
jgi:hypothetical protein